MSTTICSENKEREKWRRNHTKQHAAAWWYLFMRDRHIKMRNLHIKKGNIQQKIIQQCGAHNKYMEYLLQRKRNANG